MNAGIRVIICIMAVVLIMIAEKGVPVKLRIRDMILYAIVLCVFINFTGGF